MRRSRVVHSTHPATDLQRLLGYVAVQVGRWKTPLRASPTFGKLLFIRGCQEANHHRTVAEPSLSHRSDVRWRTRTYSAVLPGRAAGSGHPDRATGAGATGPAVTARVLVQVLLVVVLGEVEARSGAISVVIRPCPARSSTGWKASRVASAVFRCSSEWWRIADLYWVPTSLPWRMPWVGS